MKRWIFALISVIMLLGLTACASAPEPTAPAYAYDLAYDMTDYAYFSEIIEEKSSEEWDAMGDYTLLLNGLHTPVLVDMKGMDVLAVHAYGQTAELGASGATYQGEIPVGIRTTENAVVVNITLDHSGQTWILTDDKCHAFLREGDVSTQVYVQEDGTLAYGRYWGEYLTSFEQWDTAPLELCTSRDHFLYETGRAEICGAEVILTPGKTVTVSDEYDLDAMFAEAKAFGMFEEYETLDALLAANRARTGA